MNANVEAKAVVIGGGITGLCAAYYLSRELGREQVLLLEASDYLGGHVRTDHINGFSCDWGPNGFLDREPTTLEWIRDLGLSDRMVKANEAAARRFIYRDGKLHEIKPPPAFLASPILSMRGRARLLCEPLLPPKQNDAPESIYDFAARRIGREAADMLVSPMVSGIFGGDAKRLSLEHCFPRMRAMEAEHGSLFKALMAKRKENKKASAMGPGGVLTSFDQGASLLPETASSALGNRAIRNCGAISVVREGDKFIIRGANGIEVRSQFLIIATPAFATADIVCGWDEALAKSLRTIPYISIAVVCTGYARAKVGHDMNGFGFLAPRTQGLRVLGSIWTSSLFPSQAPEDTILLRSMFGGATDPDAVELSDDEFLDHIRREIHPLLSITAPPDFVRIFRHRRGIPQYTLQHGAVLKAVEAAEERHPGLLLAGNAYRGVGLNDCVLSAHRAVRKIVALA